MKENEDQDDWVPRSKKWKSPIGRTGSKDEPYYKDEDDYGFSREYRYYYNEVIKEVTNYNPELPFKLYTDEAK